MGRQLWLAANVPLWAVPVHFNKPLLDGGDIGKQCRQLYERNPSAMSPAGRVLCHTLVFVNIF